MPPKPHAGSTAAAAPAGEKLFELGNLRRVQVSRFRDHLLVNIREWYTDRATGEVKPGAKGIALKVDEFYKLLELGPQIVTQIVAEIPGAPPSSASASAAAAAAVAAPPTAPPPAAGVSIASGKRKADVADSSAPVAAAAPADSTGAGAPGAKSKKRKHSKLRKLVQEVLAGIDWNTASVRAVLEKVEAQRGKALSSSKRELVRTEIEQALTERSKAASLQ